MRKSMSMRMLPALALTVFVGGCSSLQEDNNVRSFEDVNRQVQGLEEEQARMLSPRPIVYDVEGVYLGSGQTVSRDRQRSLPGYINQHIALYDAAPLNVRQIARLIQDDTGLVVQVRDGGSERARGLQQYNNHFSGSPDDELVRLLGGGSGISSRAVSSERMSLKFEGRLSQLMDQVANHFDMDWSYNDGTITLSRISTKVYELASLAGAVSYNADMANTAGSGSGGVGNEASYVSTSGGLSTQYSADVDQWEAIEDILDEVLDDNGSYAINQAASSVIVTAPPSVHAHLKEFIDSYNEILTRQVALNVSVFTLNVDDANSFGFDLNAVYESMSRDYQLNLAGPALSNLGGSEFGAQLFESADSRFGGSQAVLQALAEWGETSIVTSTTGVVLNGQVFPIQDVNRRTYLAETEINRMDGAGTSLSMTPGVVTTGFSMQVVPQFWGNNQLMLQYAFTLSSLKEMVELTSGEQSIQGPDVDDRSFTQRTLMPLGSTLVIAGFQRDEDTTTRRAGVGGGSRRAAQGKTMVFVTITANKA